MATGVGVRGRITCPDGKFGGAGLRKLISGQDSGDDSYLSPPLDSGLPDCCWHRLVLDADIPINSFIAIACQAGESPGLESAWSAPVTFTTNALDALVPPVTGRYLRLRIQFHQEGEAGPVLRQVKVFYPRQSYLRYLPALYREREPGRNFQERWLAMFETIMAESGAKITDLPRYLDPDASPSNFYPWLADWLALDLFELLGDRNREFIQGRPNFTGLKARWPAWKPWFRF